MSARKRTYTAGGRHRSTGQAPVPDSAHASVACPGQDLDTDLQAEQAYTPSFAAVEERFLSFLAAYDASCTRIQPATDGSRQLPGLVIRLDRGYPLVLTRAGSFRAEHAINLVKNAGLRAAVGDWVLLDVTAAHDKAVIAAILPRINAFSRWDGHRQGQRQVLAANIDKTVVVQALSARGLLPDRVARSAVLAHEAGLETVLVLTKADRVDSAHIQRQIDAIRSCIGSHLDIVATSAHAGTGLEDAAAVFAPGSISLLLGESGAGKSSLVNALLGADVLGTSEVRGKDDAGRHTTVARRMLQLPGAGIIVDAPGLRSLPLLDEYTGLDLTFPVIAQLVDDCRFHDCTHTAEPGCAVRAAVADGRIPAACHQQFCALLQEMRNHRLGLDKAAGSSITS